MTFLGRVLIFTALVCVWITPAVINLYLTIYAPTVRSWIHWIILDPMMIIQLTLAVYAGWLIGTCGCKCQVNATTKFEKYRTLLSISVSIGYIVSLIVNVAAFFIRLDTAEHYDNVAVYNSILIGMYLLFFIIGLVVINDNGIVRKKIIQYDL